MNADLNTLKKMRRNAMNKEEEKIERECRKIALRHRCILAKIVSIHTPTRGVTVYNI